jgi:TonB-linked SusC/RagA family outer membrane protein
MKKIRFSLTDDRFFYLPKILLIMKLSTLLILINLTGIAANGYSQIENVTIKLKDADLKEFFASVEKQTLYKFLYRDDAIESIKVNLDESEKPLNQVITQVLAGSGFTYKILTNNLIVIASQDLFQQIKVSGIVTDGKTGEPLPGVNVSVKGTTIGIVTGTDGRFDLNVPDAMSTLSFSFIGFKTQEIALNGKSVVNVSLVSDLLSLEEVVVVGYGTQKKATLTGSISTVGTEELQNKGVVTNALSAIQGTIAGVNITRSSGAPGRENFNFEIRGSSSINGSSPLIVVDGIPMSNADGLRSINPEDIESFTVLKDASAAIYGARAAGGVVLITMKRGRESQALNVTYKSNVQFKKPGLMMKYMNMQEWATTFKAGFANDGLVEPAVFPQAVMDAFLDPSLRPQSGWLRNPDPASAIYDYTFFDTDWHDVLYGTGVSQMHNLNISGSTNNSAFMVSLAYVNDGSTLKWGEDWNKKYNVRMNYDVRLSTRLKLENSLSIEKNNNTSPSQSFNYDYPQPGFATSSIDGKPYSWETWRTPNWMAELGGSSETQRTRINGSARVTLDILKGLQFIGNAGLNYWISDNRTWINSVNYYSFDGTHLNGSLPAPNSVYRGFGSDQYLNYTGYLNYKNTFFNNHKLSLMVGGSYETDLQGSVSSQRTNLFNQELHTLNLGTASTSTNDENITDWAIGSYFGRFNYSYKDKYLIEANLRYDGSSKFIGDSRWKAFYGFSGGWRVIEENFLKNQKIIDDLKLRVSWGQTGNQDGIGIYDYAQLLTINSWSSIVSNVPNFGVTGPTAAQTIRLSGMVSNTRTWETIENTNYGIDFSILKSRLVGSFDYFFKKNKNMLIGVTYPQLLGATAPRTNNGELHSQGYEISLGWRDKIGDFHYFIKGNLSDSKNKIVSLGGLSPLSLGTVTAREGYPMYTHFGWLHDGFIQSAEDLADYKSKISSASGLNYSKLTLGDAKFKDVSGPAGIPDGVLNQYDAVDLGDAGNHKLYSLTFGAEFKGFDFSAFFQGVGQHLLNRDGYFRAPLIGWWLGQNKAFYGNTWSQENPTAELPRLSTVNNSYNYRISDWYLEDGSYVRLKNIVVGYTLPRTMVNKVNLSAVRVYFSGNDLWERQHIRSGFDPEATTYPGARPNTTNASGNDAAYPFNRVYSFGVDITF